MSENRFTQYENPEGVILAFRAMAHHAPNHGIPDLVDEALARIRELTPPLVVSEEAKQRARGVIHRAAIQWGKSLTYNDADQVLGDITAALGFSPDDALTFTNHHVVSEEARERARRVLANGPFGDEGEYGHIDRIIDALGYTPAPRPFRDVETQPWPDDAPVSPPIMDFDANDLQVMGDRLKEWERVALDLYVDETHQIPTTVGRIVHNGSAWVLRIGGDQ